MKVAFLGLGVMGAPMAGHLARAGFDVAAYNRTAAKAEAWYEEHGRAHGARVAASPAETVEGARLAFLCLGDDPDVAAAAREVLPVLPEGAVLVDHTTASPALARRLAEEAGAAGKGFVDAPVSGGQAGAEKGALSIMCGGEAAHVERARPAMESYAARIVHIGPSGHGQLCKAVNQICIAGLLQALAEGMHFAGRAGLNIERVLEAISGGAAQSWQMDNRARTMVADEFDFGFAVDWMRKDLRIALDEARASGARLPVTALVDQFYADLQAMGGGRWDTSSLIRRLTDAD
ncbi:NAD(P)-dependent oxidoreductase [Amphiplicatus metriothermophilus]|uniref:3-hydroxyisobutyrate dehydrogenase n=1 Tax=Amphiplicatus metriothermophilus TaxID=1519374 RepID=A0A239PXQ9_9PROT|nr:NAD(P)-dependent oxidoreductase [Amphiplicatus metriothermophilus]MBB5519838.1 3-hydroxyisobutyrate dehydrogenase-like beta-hydroxyacid dehydrogenase [Amphiplicatus metriothermophilus]SNT75111.1 3-hydroxyisobutyrate dehydrogenase [Amphiplicatus metriothermophilus]